MTQDPRARIEWRDLTAILASIQELELAGATDAEALLRAGEIDAFLDHPATERVVLASPSVLARWSLPTFLVVGMRACIRRTPIANPGVASYVAALALAELAAPGFAEVDETLAEKILVADGEGLPAQRVWLEVADRALWIAGMLHVRVRARARRRGAPGIEYYEGLGQDLYLRLSQASHPSDESAAVFADLGEQFRQVRMALNEFAETHLFPSAGSPDDRVLDRIERDVAFRLD